MCANFSAHSGIRLARPERANPFHWIHKVIVWDEVSMLTDKHLILCYSVSSSSFNIILWFTLSSVVFSFWDMLSFHVSRVFLYFMYLIFFSQSHQAATLLSIYFHFVSLPLIILLVYYCIPQSFLFSSILISSILSHHYYASSFVTAPSSLSFVPSILLRYSNLMVCLSIGQDLLPNSIRLKLLSNLKRENPGFLALACAEQGFYAFSTFALCPMCYYLCCF